MKTENLNKRWKKTFPGLLFALLSIAALLLAACQPMGLPNTGAGIPNTGTSMPNMGTGMPNTGGSSTQAPSTSQSVTMMNTAFNPKQITVKVGTTVVWTNKDTMAHTVTADNNSFDSGNLNPGDTFKFTFTKAGTFPYHCKYHGGPNGQGMSGTIIVTGS